MTGTDQTDAVIISCTAVDRVGRITTNYRRITIIIMIIIFLFIIYRRRHRSYYCIAMFAVTTTIFPHAPSPILFHHTYFSSARTTACRLYTMFYRIFDCYYYHRGRLTFSVKLSRARARSRKYCFLPSCP